MNILVVNAGSSSLKYQLIDMNNEAVIAKGGVERIGMENSFLKGKGKGGADFVINKDIPNHSIAISSVLDALVDSTHGVLEKITDIDAVGHRVVHSGEDFSQSVLVTDEVIKICENNIDLAPLHMPANIEGIKACREVMPNTPMVCVFDTAFHSTIPQHAYMYAIPYSDYKEYKIRRYGFHGTSHKYVSQEAANYLNKDIKDLKIITCHLGNGASICAVDGGKSIDTSMGFTPLEGLAMGTRSGDIDPAVIEYIMNKKGYSISMAIKYLNHECGVKGLSGISSDFRDLTENDEFKNQKSAILAVDVFSYRVKKYIGAYAAAMGGVDVIVFTAGIGEHTPVVRDKVMRGLEFLGVDFNVELNYNVVRGKLTELSTPKSKVKVLLIPTNEELVIARETKQLVKSV